MCQLEARYALECCVCLRLVERVDEAVSYGPDLNERRYRRGICRSCWAEIKAPKQRVAAESAEE